MTWAPEFRTHCPYGHPYNTKNTYVDRDGYPHCRTCRKLRQSTPEMREFFKLRARQRKADGLCAGCGNERESRRKLCNHCTLRNAEYQKKYRARRTRKGICRDCPQPVSPGQRLCEEHREKARVEAEARRYVLKIQPPEMCANGNHENDRYPQFVTCSWCAEEQREYTKRYRLRKKARASADADSDV